MMREKLVKTISVLLVLAMLVTLLAACAGGRNKKKEIKSAKSTELEVWVFFDMNTPDSYYLNLWEQLADKKGYTVDLKVYSTEQIKEKVRIALACNELPDIFLVWGGNYPNYLFDAGACLPVQKYLEQADFRSSYTRAYKDGNNYIIPCLVEAYAVTYSNSELMQKMNLQMPANWEELLDFVKKVNAYNQKHRTDYAAIELGDKDSWLGELLYCMMVNRIDPNAYDRLKADPEIFQKDAVFTDAAKKVRRLVKENAFNADFLETGEVEAVQNFIDGEAVLFPHQSTIVYYLMKNMGKDAFQVEQFPDCSENPSQDYASYMMDINHTSTPGLCISSRSEHKEEAANLCLTFAKQVNQINVEKYGYLNMTTESLQVPQNLAEPLQQFRMQVEHARKMTSYWYAELPDAQGNAWRNLTKKLFAGERSVRQFMNEGEKYLTFPEEYPQ